VIRLGTPARGKKWHQQNAKQGSRGPNLKSEI
jgi:hypothetical protein